MAITPTPNNSIYKGLVFDDIDSRDYGIYITGSAVFNSPERDVEMIEIPGRNGSYALDNGRFNNIEVTYPAGLFGGSEADFAAGIRAFRNALASRIGYKRLEDDYNQNEYRMAVYKSGLDVTPAQLKAGEFEITFDCQPQRFLTSGETAVNIATSGGTITNPTLFDASPMLEITGTGSVTINDDTITVNGDEAIGRVLIASAVTADCQTTLYNALNDGDTFTVSNIAITSQFIYANSGAVSSIDYSGWSGFSYSQDFEYLVSNDYMNHTITAEELTYTQGTSSTIEDTQTITVNFSDSTTATITESISITYNGENRIECYLTATIPTGWSYNTATRFGETYGVSTKTTAGDPAYIDLDIGEAYKIESGTVISLNNTVSIPASLPVLSPGSNTITFDDTVSRLDIVPRWWRV